MIQTIQTESSQDSILIHSSLNNDACGCDSKLDSNMIQNLF